MRLYRDNTSNILSAFIIIIGFGLIIVSFLGMKKEQEDDKQAEESRKAEEEAKRKAEELMENPDGADPVQ